MITILSILFCGFAQSLWAEPSLEQTLQNIKKDPHQFRVSRLPRWDSQGHLRQDPTHPLRLFQFRTQMRKMVTGGVELLEVPKENDQVQKLVDNENDFIDKLDEIAAKKLEDVTLPEQPWSGDYWPLYQGVLGGRILDKSFPMGPSWKEKYDYVTANPALDILHAGNLEKIETLSVSEKYDFLIGDDTFHLTKQMWDEGRKYYERDGIVETWMGICHGWALASLNMPRPDHIVDVIGSDGKTSLTFNPSELKGLASYLWAATPTPHKFVGGRCDEKDPKLDETGRPVNSECLDTNPATLHLALVNQIGVSRRGFVMDATADYEVWNQPVFGYKLHYFNPKTMEPMTDAKSAQVAVGEFSNDKYKKFRSVEAKSILGVIADVSYVLETYAGDNDMDDEKGDEVRHIRYVYDLEVDGNGRIIGGEWYNNQHPDFLWINVKGTKPMSWLDQGLAARGGWKGEGALPQMWRSAAQRVSQDGKVLLSIIEKLFERSQN